MKEETSFIKALELNVSDKIEKKGGLSYLSWSYAWAEFKKIYKDGTYKIIKNDQNMPYFHSPETGFIVYTEVTAEGETFEMWLPVMDFRNQAMTNPTMFDINKTVMRCLTKNLAMFGIGLYIYSGEDLPENCEDAPPVQNNQKPAYEKNDKAWLNLLNQDGTPKDKVWGRILNLHNEGKSADEIITHIYLTLNMKNIEKDYIRGNL